MARWLLLTLLVGTRATAEDEEASAHAGADMIEHFREVGFDVYDANLDGSLTFAELESRQLLEILASHYTDRLNDGTQGDGTYRMRDARVWETAQDVFDAFDENADDRLSRDEAVAMYRKWLIANSRREAGQMPPGAADGRGKRRRASRSRSRSRTEL